MVDVKRNYDASRRQEVARLSRARILDAARARFLRDGYAATTIAAVAADADVAVQTVTKHFASKPGLVKALFDVALVGDDAGVPLAAREWITAILEQPDPQRKLRMYAETLATLLPRTAPIQLLIRDAAGDPAIAVIWQQIRTGRLFGMNDLARNLHVGRHLRADVTIEQARDVLWTFSSPELYELVVTARGWSTDQYVDLLYTATVASLLGSTIPEQ
jgi:AcrR family transcriptional regulator